MHKAYQQYLNNHVALLSIKIKIGDREYPLKVEAEDEHNVRQAGRLLNERMKSYREQFGLSDKVDLLALAAFDCTMENLKLLQSAGETSQKTKDRLKQLHLLLDQVQIS